MKKVEQTIKELFNKANVPDCWSKIEKQTENISVKKAVNSPKKKRYSQFYRAAGVAVCLVFVLTSVLLAQRYLKDDEKGIINTSDTQSSITSLEESTSSSQMDNSKSSEESYSDTSQTDNSETDTSETDTPGIGGPGWDNKNNLYYDSGNIQYSLCEYIMKDDPYWYMNIERNYNLPTPYEVIKYYNISKDKYIEILKEESEHLTLSNIIYNADILYSGDEKLIEYYYTDLSKPICYHNDLYHFIRYIADYYTDDCYIDPTDDPKHRAWRKTCKSLEDGNIVSFVKYFDVPKEKLIELAEKANVDIDADVVYSNDKKRIYEYFKDPNMDCPDYSYEYFVIPNNLLEYVGYNNIFDSQYMDEINCNTSERIIEKNMEKVNWMLKYKDDPNGINIVNFVKDHNIPKDVFISLYEIDPDFKIKEEEKKEIADIVYSNDQNLIDEYYKLT